MTSFDVVDTHHARSRVRQIKYKLLHLSGCDLRGTRLQWIHLEGANLAYAHLGAFLRGAHLEGAILGGARFEGAFIKDVHFEGTDLTETHFKDLQKIHLELAFGDAKTRLPDDIPRPTRWPPYAPD